MTDAAGSARGLLLKSIGLAHGSHEKVKHGWETDQGELDGARHHLLVLCTISLSSEPVESTKISSPLTTMGQLS